MKPPPFPAPFGGICRPQGLFFIVKIEWGRIEMEQLDFFTRFYQALISKPEYIIFGLFLFVFFIFVLYMIIDKRNHKDFVDTVMQQNDKREERYITIIDGALKDMTGNLSAVCNDVKCIKEDVEEMKRGAGN